MSLLWEGESSRQLLTSNGNPSPTFQPDKVNKKNNSGFAQKPNKLSDHPVKGISLFTLLRRGVSGGMTVEAALVLPLFLFFFLNLSCSIELIRLHGNLQLALWETGTSLAVYGHVLGEEELLRSMEEKEDSWWEEMAGIAFSYTYIRNQLVDYLGEDYLRASPLVYGVDGLQFWESEVLRSGDEMEITVTYAVSPWYSVAGFKPFRMANRYYGHIWNGYDIVGGAGANEDALVTVYVTDTGEVYHRAWNCSHLQLSVREVAADLIASCRNEDGKRYGRCEKCKSDIHSDVLYITEEGECYHYSRACPGLKRTVYSILLKDAGEYRPCSRCGGGG